VIDRYYFVRLRDEHAHEAGRAEAITRCRQALAGADEALTVTAGTPADASAQSWDLGIVVRSADLAALAALLARPAVADFFDRWLAERSVVVKAWSFQAA
jgi:hypothetical protein